MSAVLETRAGRQIELPTVEEDAVINAGIAAGRDSHELDADWFKRALPAADVLPPTVYAEMRAHHRKPGERGPQRMPTKERVSLRLSRHVVESFRATGDG